MSAASSLGRLIAWAGTVGLALLLSGCTTPSASERIHGHGTVQLPRGARTVAFTTARDFPRFGMVQPLTKDAAMRSLAAETATGAAADPRGAILLPAGYVIGGLVGATLGADPEAIAHAVHAIETALADARLENRIAALCEASLAQHPGVTIRRLAQPVPVDPRPTPSATALPRHPLHDTDIDVVVGWWLSSLQFRFLSPQADSPLAEVSGSVALEIGFEISTVCPRDGSSAGGVTFLYQSEPHAILRWAADDAALLRRELDRFLATLSQELAERVCREK